MPSQTELLADLGLSDEVVGITKFCIHPEAWFRAKTRVGGTKNISLDKIRALQPDLIIANKEENVREQIEDLQKAYPVWISDIKRLEDAIAMIREVGRMIGKESKADAIVDRIEHNFDVLALSNVSEKSVAYLIWNEPIMVASGQTFIGDMLRRAGFDNVFENAVERYPESSLEELKRLAPKLVLLSSEPFPFREKHVQILRKELPFSRIMLVDGELFSWYGSRLLKTADYLQHFKEIQ